MKQNQEKNWRGASQLMRWLGSTLILKPQKHIMKLPEIDVRKHDKNSKIYWKPVINTKLWGGEIWTIWVLRYTITIDWRGGFKITDLLVNDEEKESFWKRIGIWNRRN